MKMNPLFLATIALGLMLAFPRKTWATPPAGQVYDAVFKEAEISNGLPAGLLSRMAYQESRYNPNAVSPAGAVGIMQIIPRWHPTVDPYDPVDSIFYAAQLMRQYYNEFGNWPAAIAAYNWGITNVRNKGIQSLPDETRIYIDQVLPDVGLAGYE